MYENNMSESNGASKMETNEQEPNKVTRQTVKAKEQSEATNVHRNVSDNNTVQNLIVTVTPASDEVSTENERRREIQSSPGKTMRRFSQDISHAGKILAVSKIQF